MKANIRERLKFYSLDFKLSLLQRKVGHNEKNQLNICFILMYKAFLNVTSEL